MATEHSNLANEAILAVSRHKLGRTWRNETGTGKSLYGNRKIKFGLTGSCDVIGILKNGLFIGIEIKIGADKLSEEQEDFKAMVIRNKGIHFVLKTMKDLDDMIDKLKEMLN